MRTVFIVAVDSITSGGFDWFASSVKAYEFFSKTKRETDIATWEQNVTFHKARVPTNLTDREISEYIGNNGLDEPECGKCSSYPYFFLEDWHAKLAIDETKTQIIDIPARLRLFVPRRNDNDNIDQLVAELASGAQGVISEGEDISEALKNAVHRYILESGNKKACRVNLSGLDLWIDGKNYNVHQLD